MSLTAEDLDLVAAAAAVIDVPKAAPPSSFVLHAPLELLARALLIERLPEDQRGEPRDTVRWLVDEYRNAGPSAVEPPPALDASIDDVVVSLAAAGHAPILLSLRPRVPAVPPTFGDALVATEIARNPTWRLEWPRTRPADGRGSGDLESRLSRPRAPGDPGSDFIYPTMHLTEASGLAEEVLDEPLRRLSVADARCVLLRTAARSMLQDDPKAAPYGWTHCLTMPQAVLIAAGHGADPDVAIAVAATYVLGFRATQGQIALDPVWTPVPGTAAARAWSASPSDLPDLVVELAAFGAAHRDAHVAKYTLACIDAAEADPDAAHLYLAAAAHLHEWWRAVEPELSAAG